MLYFGLRRWPIYVLSKSNTLESFLRELVILQLAFKYE